MRRKIAGVLMAAVAMCAVGCTSYYKVTDPTTGKTYYTTELKQSGHGAARLKDARTGTTVNLQNSEITQIKKEEFEAGKYSAPAAGTASKSSAFEQPAQSAGSGDMQK